MRISYWSAAVCSSDLVERIVAPVAGRQAVAERGDAKAVGSVLPHQPFEFPDPPHAVHRVDQGEHPEAAGMLAVDLADLAVKHVAQEAVFYVRPVHVGDDRRALPVALVRRAHLSPPSGRAAPPPGAII